MSRIEKLQERLNTTLDNITTLADKVESEERDFDADEQGTYDTLKQDVESLNKQIAREKEIEELAKSRAVPVSPTAAEVHAYGSGARSNEKKLKGQLLVDMARAMYFGGGKKWAAAEYALQKGMKEAHAVFKAVTEPAETGVAGWAAELVRDGYGDFIDLLRPESVYARAPGMPAVLGRNGKLLFPGLTTGLGGGWVGQAQPIPVVQGVTNEQEISPYKLRVISVQTNDIMERSDPSSDVIIRDAMVRDTAIVLDTTFVSDDAASAGVSPAGIRNGVTPIDGSPAGATNTIEEIDAALAAAVGACLAANMTASLFWILNPVDVLKLRNRSTATGTYPYRDELDSGMLMGYPALQSNTQTAGVQTLVHSGSFYKLNEGMIEMAMSTEATLHYNTVPEQIVGGDGVPALPSAGNVRSLFQEDSVGLRLIMPASWGVMRTDAVQVITGIVIQ